MIFPKKEILTADRGGKTVRELLDRDGIVILHTRPEMRAVEKEFDAGYGENQRYIVAGGFRPNWADFYFIADKERFPDAISAAFSERVGDVLEASVAGK